MKKQKKFILLCAELEFLKKDLEITREIITIANGEFNQELVNHTEESANPQKNSSRNICAKPEAEIHKQKHPENIKLPEDQRKLFKEIVKKTHPDKLQGASQFEKDLKKGMLDKAMAAAEESDYFTLMKLAQELNLDLPEITNNHIKNIENNIISTKKEITALKNSYAWVWYFENDKNRKIELIKEFINRTKR